MPPSIPLTSHCQNVHKTEYSATRVWSPGLFLSASILQKYTLILSGVLYATSHRRNPFNAESI